MGHNTQLSRNETTEIIDMATKLNVKPKVYYPKEFV